MIKDDWIFNGGLILKEEIFLERIEGLIQKGKEVSATAQVRYSTSNEKFTDEGLTVEWQTSCLSFLRANFKDTPYFERFRDEVTSSFDYDATTGLAILRALKGDIEKGYLTSYRTLVIADVFSNFLDMAEHLLENEYKDPSASLIGAVLENGLRKICDNHKTTIKSKDNISSLNRKLADNKIYTRIVQRQIEVWNKIRDYADHGHFNEYKKEDVEGMFKGVSNFLSNYLK